MLFLEEAKEGDIITVGAGFTVGSAAIWTATVNVTIGAAGALGSSPATKYEVRLRLTEMFTQSRNICFMM